MKLKTLKELENLDFERLTQQLRDVAIDGELCIEMNGECYYDKNVILHAIMVAACVSFSVAQEIIGIMIEIGLIRVTKDEGSILVRIL